MNVLRPILKIQSFVVKAENGMMLFKKVNAKDDRLMEMLKDLKGMFEDHFIKTDRERYGTDMAPRQ